LNLLNTWMLVFEHPLSVMGAVMAANARTFLSLFLISAVNNVCFQTKTSETHLFDTNNSPAAPRIEIRERNLEYFAVVLYRYGKSKLQLP